MLCGKARKGISVLGIPNLSGSETYNAKTNKIQFSRKLLFVHFVSTKYDEGCIHLTKRYIYYNRAHISLEIRFIVQFFKRSLVTNRNVISICVFSLPSAVRRIFRFVHCPKRRRRCQLYQHGLRRYIKSHFQESCVLNTGHR